MQIMMLTTKQEELVKNMKKISSQTSIYSLIIQMKKKKQIKGLC